MRLSFVIKGILLFTYLLCSEENDKPTILQLNSLFNNNPPCNTSDKAEVDSVIKPLLALRKR